MDCFFIIQHLVRIWIISTLQILGLSVEPFDKPEKATQNYLSDWENKNKQKSKRKTQVLYG